MTNNPEQVKFLDSRGNIVYIRGDCMLTMYITFDGILDYLSWHEAHLHRIDGPAVEWHDGAIWWALNGSIMSRTTWKTSVRQYYQTDEDYLLMLLKLD